MAKISKIKVGQILYDKHKYRMGNTTMMAWGLWEVYVKEVDPNGEFIVASWNGNPAKRMYAYEVKKLKVKEPDMSKLR
jgi:hypothetical protein